MSGKLLKPREVAEQLGLHYKTVCELIASGELPASNVSGGTGTGKRWRVKPADLDRWLQSRSTAA